MNLLMIFRVPDPKDIIFEQREITLTMVPAKRDPTIMMWEVDLAQTGKVFYMRDEDDWYNQSAFDHVIIAQPMEGGSTHPIRFVVEGIGEIHEQEFEVLREIAGELTEAYFPEIIKS